jgi:hypothetical protein
MSHAERQPVQASRPAKKCGATTTGPSAEEWEAYRATITELYKRMRWNDMDEIMRTEYGFVAR